MESTISKQEMIRRVDEQFFRAVLQARSLGTDVKIDELSDYDLAQYLMIEYSEGELQHIWQNYVLRMSPTYTANKLQRKEAIAK